MERRDFLKGSVLAAGAAMLATPAIAQIGKYMVIVSTWPREFPGLGISAQRMAARIEELAAGSIRVQYFAAGERVGAFDSFDEVASSNSHACIAADYYWKGKHPGWAPFTSVSFGLTYTEMEAWIKYAGGQTLWDEIAGEFGLKKFAAGNTGVQMGGWFNKEIESADDLKGLKIRIPGLGGDVMAKLGASPVSLPGGQIYENLVSGAIDATEWVGPYNDFFLKFYEAAKILLLARHARARLSGLLWCQWEFLGLIVENRKSDHRSGRERGKCKNDGRGKRQQWYFLAKLITEHGVELREFNDDVYDAFGEASAEVIEEARDHSDLAKRIFDSILTARKDIGGWTAIADAAYVAKRNRVLDI